jgi:ribosomal protein S12 methylthiotransferase accessory factor
VYHNNFSSCQISKCLNPDAASGQGGGGTKTDLQSGGWISYTSPLRRTFLRLSTMQPGNLHRLAPPLGGLIGKISHFWLRGDEPRMHVQSSRAGEVRRVLPELSTSSRAQISGAGSGLNMEQCALPSLGEALERYSVGVFSKAQFITRTANELKAEALDLDTIPRCSDRELAHPKCSLRCPDKKAPIRWIRGLSLLDGRPVFLPVVMVHLHAGFINPQERFWFPISTGCAGHISFERALLSAVLEIIERDALSVLWLQKLALPRIEVDVIPASLAPYWERYQASSEELEYYLFNATTDLGVPVIYGLQRSPANKRLTTLVSCSAALDPVEAVIKVIRDMAACRIANRAPKPIPDSWDDFMAIFHGATYMAQAEQAHAFSFLVDSGRKQALSSIPAASAASHEDDRARLRTILDILFQAQLEVYAVDLTTDEALRSGVRVVRVLIPGLQPVGFHYRSRYLGHSRLYEAPKKMGYKVNAEEELNMWPQPFA